MIIISNSSPLIKLSYLSYQNSSYLDFLLKLGKIITTNIVKNEVLKEGKPNYDILKEFFNKIEVKEVNINEELQKIINLDEGELSCILLFSELSKEGKEILFLTDDQDAKIFVEKVFNIRVIGTLGLIVEFYKRGFIPKTEAEETIKNIREKTRLHVSDDIIQKALELLENKSPH